MPIDIDRPLVLDTSPPRAAHVEQVDENDRRLPYNIRADWQDNGQSYKVWCDLHGAPCVDDLPPVRNATVAETGAPPQEDRLTLRDQFAIAALPAVWNMHPADRGDDKRAAERAYDIADAMMLERVARGIA